MSEKAKEWAWATAQLMIRGGLIAATIAVGVTSVTVGDAATFDAIFTVTTAKAFAAGAVISLVFSYLSGRVGDQGTPTV